MSSAGVGLLVLAVALASPPSPTQEVTELVLAQHPFRVYSAFWPNLHHALLTEAALRRAPAGTGRATSMSEAAHALSEDERRAWEGAVSYYERELVGSHPLFDMAPIRKALLAAGEEPSAEGLEAAHREALLAAAPVYRKHGWPADDRANRAWVADVMSKVASLSPGVPERLSDLFGTPWFVDEVRVDVVRIASREGAFTALDPAPAHITISSAHSVLVEWTAAEMVFHEASHALARPLFDGFMAEARARGKNPRDLWHAALFYMTGEVVRDALAERDISYEPYLYSTGLFERAWPQFQPLIETHWAAYMEGAPTREEAIARIMAEIDGERPSMEEGFVDAGQGVRLFYRVVGSGRDTVVVLHGGPGFSMEYLAPDLEPLSDRYTLLFYDQRGAGRSSLVTEPAALDARRFAEDLEAVRRHFGLDRLTLLAHSWGAGVAALYAELHPERLERLVIVGGVAPRQRTHARSFERLGERRDAADRRLLEERREARLADPGDASACRAYYVVWFRPFFGVASAAARSRGDFCAGSAESLRNKVAHVDLHTAPSLGEWDWRPALRAVEADVLVIHGTEDPLLVEGAREWATALPSSRLLLLESIGHFPYVESPEAFFAAVDEFLQGRWPAGSTTGGRPGGP